MNNSKDNSSAPTIKKKIPTHRLIFFIIAIVLFGLALYYSASIEKNLRLFGKVKVGWLAIAVLSQFLTYVFGSVTYYELLRIFKVEKSITKGDLFKGNLIAIFLNQAIPSGGISGNAYIFQLMARNSIPVTNIMSLITLELLAFYFSIVLLIVGCFFIALTFYPFPFSLFIILVLGLITFAAFAIGISLVGKKQTIHWLFTKIKKISVFKILINRIAKKIPEGISLEDMENPWPIVKQNPRTFTRAVIYQGINTLADTLTIYALFYGLGSPMSFDLVLLGLILTKIITLLPVSPGALVLYEGGMSYFYSVLGPPLSATIIVTLIFRTLSFWLPMPIGFFMLENLKSKEDKRKEETQQELTSPEGS